MVDFCNCSRQMSVNEVIRWCCSHTSSGVQMTSARIFMTIVCLAALAVVIGRVNCSGPSHYHGNIQMGVSNDLCDNGQWRLWVDWDNSTDDDYRCQPDEALLDVIKTSPKQSCLDNEDIPAALHVCMTEKIDYTDQPPRGGPHRPLWPVYGEYQYLPPQRWIHSLEHGGVVFLYHPCADPMEVFKLKLLAKLCLKRRVITPYRNLPLHQPLAILTYGCKLTMSRVDFDVSKQFIKENAINPDRASEAGVWSDGQYTYGLSERAEVIPGSDYRDSNLCPDNDSDYIAEILL